LSTWAVQQQQEGEGRVRASTSAATTLPTPSVNLAAAAVLSESACPSGLGLGLLGAAVRGAEEQERRAVHSGCSSCVSVAAAAVSACVTPPAALDTTGAASRPNAGHPLSAWQRCGAATGPSQDTRTARLQSSATWRTRRPPTCRPTLSSACTTSCQQALPADTLGYWTTSQSWRHAGLMQWTGRQSFPRP
jgi:hypothetical protein